MSAMAVRHSNLSKRSRKFKGAKWFKKNKKVRRSNRSKMEMNKVFRLSMTLRDKGSFQESENKFK